jgi:purine-nucleoside phosphorylase
MGSLKVQLEETVSYIKSICSQQPDIGIVLGSGLSNFVNEIKIEAEIPYEGIPRFPVSTVKGHPGKLVFGEINGKKVVVMVGRFHYYEGYSSSEVVYPIRVLKALGIKNLFISNAAGGVHPDFRVGDLMIIRDHLSFAIVNPLIGPNDEEVGPRFPDMSEPYNKELIEKAKQIAGSLGYRIHEGVYFGVTGPTFETRAEYKMIRLLGGDAVGMSTVQEVITAVHAGLSVFGISIITDIGIREEDNIITHDDVLEAAGQAEPKLTAIFHELIASV